jgi:hypothetical protein
MVNENKGDGVQREFAPSSRVSPTPLLRVSVGAARGKRYFIQIFPVKSINDVTF